MHNIIFSTRFNSFVFKLYFVVGIIWFIFFKRADLCVEVCGCACLCILFISQVYLCIVCYHRQNLIGYIIYMNVCKNQKYSPCALCFHYFDWGMFSFKLFVCIYIFIYIYNACMVNCIICVYKCVKAPQIYSFVRLSCSLPLPDNNQRHHHHQQQQNRSFNTTPR